MTWKRWSAPHGRASHLYWNPWICGRRVEPRSSWGRSSVGRAPPLQGGGQGFESPRLHQNRRAVDPRQRARPRRSRRRERAKRGSSCTFAQWWPAKSHPRSGTPNMSTGTSVILRPRRGQAPSRPGFAPGDHQLLFRFASSCREDSLSAEVRPRGLRHANPKGLYGALSLRHRLGQRHPADIRWRALTGHAPSKRIGASTFP